MSQFNLKLYQSAQLRQEMRINPRLYQAMELLYMPLLDLQQHLKQELTENPFLEMSEADVEQDVELKDDTSDEPLGDEVDWEAILLDGFDVGGRRQQYEHREHFEPTPVEAQDLHDYLNDQLRLLSISERELRLGEELIGDIDDAGMLVCTHEEAVQGVNEWLDEVRPAVIARAEVLEDEAERTAELAEIAEVFRPYEPIEAERMLTVIQTFDPPGVGARSVRESILIQLGQRDEEGTVQYQIVDAYFDELINHRWTELAKAMEITPKEVQDASTRSTPTTMSSPTSSSRRSTVSTWFSRTTRACLACGFRSRTARSQRTSASSPGRTRNLSRRSSTPRTGWSRRSSRGARRCSR